MSDFFCYSGASAVTYSNKAWSDGDRMIPTLADGTSNVNIARRAVWKCTTAGTTTATPTWPASITYGTTTVTQNGVVFTACRPGYDTDNSTFAWNSATLYAHYVCLAYANQGTAGDRCGFASDHAESQATINVSFGHPGTMALPAVFRSLDRSKTPFATDSYLAGAQVTTTGAVSISVNGNGAVDWAGINLRAASGGSGAALNICASAGPSYVVMRDSNLENNSTVSTGVINFGVASATAPALVKLINCFFKHNFSSSGNTLLVIRSTTELEIEGGGALSGSGSPTSFAWSAVGGAGGSYGKLRVTGFDFTNYANNIFLTQGGARGGMGYIEFIDCKMNSLWNLVTAQITTPGFTAVATGCGNTAAAASTQAWRETWIGNVKNDLTVYRSGGQSDGITPRSTKFTTTSGVSGYPIAALESWIRPRYQAVSASPVTFKIHTLTNRATKLTDAEIGVRVAYLSSGSSPVATWVDDLKSGVLVAEADQTTNSETWLATNVRQNSSTYVVGDAVMVSSNPGRVFFVIDATGTTSGSLPAGYATAVDGDSVTDGSHVLRAGWRQELSVSFTPAAAGATIHRVELFPASTVGVYVDDRPVVT